jgi:hypothetical protein
MPISLMISTKKEGCPMGGRGSGRESWWGASGSGGTVEDCKSLDVLALLRAGVFALESAGWTLPWLSLRRN